MNSIDNTIANKLLNFDRPCIQEALSLVEHGLVENFIVKDISRFDIDYIYMGHYAELIFPSRDVRFIAVNDGVDSARGISKNIGESRPTATALTQGTEITGLCTKMPPLLSIVLLT